MLADPRKAAAILILLSATAVRAAEVQISFAALQRILASQVFTDEGRRYVRGSRSDKCNYAWLESPQVRNANGRLVVRARFTGRTSVDFLGRCIGVGDSFALTITAVPYYDKGTLGLKDVKASPDGKAGFYASRVCSVLGPSLEREFRYPLAADAKRALEDPGAQPQYPRELRRFQVTSIQVTEEAVVLGVDFAISVK